MAQQKQLSDDEVRQLFSGVASAQVQQQGVYEKAGIYWERIDAIKIVESRKKQKLWTIEKTIVHVLDDDAEKGHKVGQSVTQQIDCASDYFAREIKTMLVALWGFTAEHLADPEFPKWIDDMTVRMMSAEQPLSGMIIECDNVTILKKSAQAKSAEACVATDYFTRIRYKRSVPAKELAATLTDSEKAMFFKDGLLERMIEREAAQ